MHTKGGMLQGINPAISDYQRIVSSLALLLLTGSYPWTLAKSTAPRHARGLVAGWSPTEQHGLKRPCQSLLGTSVNVI